ncbi:MAG: hypothetical protein LBH91_01395 [Prevotellaceae bacterium]|jgi:hypothetical protein|nr:hypothetical protein [Prevotellaceae bacterium]
MKTTTKKVSYFLTMVVTVVAMGFMSCSKDDVDRWVDINNPQDVQNSLQIAQSQRVDGALPTSTSGNSGLSSSISSIGVNAGGAVVLPILYTGASVQKVYIQVVGASGHILATPVAVATTRAATNYSYVSIGIPKNIDDGSFAIQYLILDASGNNSNVVTTYINVDNDIKSCSNAYANGNDGLTFTTVDLGTVSGPVKIYYDTYTVPDRIDIYQGSDWITGTGTNPHSLIPPMMNCSEATEEDGFIGDYGYFNFNFNASKGRTITVVVSGCLGGGTAWEWNLVEAPGCQ